MALRGLERGESYCSCPDFRTNTLGTCKHVLHVLAKVKRRFDPRRLKRAYRRAKSPSMSTTTASRRCGCSCPSELTMKCKRRSAASRQAHRRLPALAQAPG